MRVRQLTEGDLSPAVAAWNRTLRFDLMTEARFRELVLGDPNYEPESTFVSVSAEGAILGLAAAVLRREPAGKDGGGSASDFGRGYLKAFFTLPGEPAYSTASALLSAAEAYCREAGKQRLAVTVYNGPYVFPGLDVRYQCTHHQLVHHGYRDVSTIECVGVGLQEPSLQSRLEACRATLAEGISVVTWRPSLLPAMRTFVAEGQMPGWFPLGWEAGYQAPQETCLLATKGTEILGWARYAPGQDRAGFGPILVLERARGRDYGALLLLECMARARESGCARMTAGWANTGFYVRHGWQVIRRFSVLMKELL